MLLQGDLNKLKHQFAHIHSAFLPQIKRKGSRDGINLIEINFLSISIHQKIETGHAAGPEYIEDFSGKGSNFFGKLIGYIRRNNAIGRSHSLLSAAIALVFILERECFIATQGTLRDAVLHFFGLTE